jgi:D-alanyl-D-alanine carboxypeptidase
MRAFAAIALMITAFGCSRSAEDQQTDQIRAQARERADAITRHGDEVAKPFEQQAEALRGEAKQTGGYDGKRLQVQSDSLREQAKLVHKQATEQAGAVKEAADAHVKALRSR